MDTPFSSLLPPAGKGGKATKGSIERKRKIAEAMMRGAYDTSPVQHWTQGAARVAQALAGGMQNRRADAMEAERNQALLQALSGNPDPQTMMRMGAEYQEPTLLQGGAQMYAQQQRQQWQQQQDATERQWRAEQAELERQAQAQAQPPVEAAAPADRTKPMNPTEMRLTAEADADVQAFATAEKRLLDAQKLLKSGNVLDGAFAGVRGTAGALLPDVLVPNGVASPEQGAASNEFGIIMSQEAITQMSELLKGATTNFELQEFKKLMANPSTPNSVKENVLNRMLELVQQRKAAAVQRAQGIRSGQYWQGGGQPAVPAESPAPTDQQYEAVKEIDGRKFGKIGNDWFEIE